MKLPKPKLDKESALNLWCAEHSEYAKEQMVLCNVGIIVSELKKIGQNPLDEDLFEIGMIGLVEAINSFDKDKGFAFSTLAYKCISNEIFQTFRKKQVPVAFSLDDNADIENGEEVPYSEMIADDKEFEEEVISSKLISEFLKSLSDKEKMIISLYLRGKTQKEISKMLNTSQPQICRTLKSCLQKCRSTFAD